MDRTRVAPAPLAAVLAALSVVGVGFATASRFGAILVHQCVAGDGMAGALGLRLALLRPDAACPSGALAVGGDSRQVMGVLVVVALPLLLVHLLGLTMAAGLLARIGLAVRTVVRVLAGLVRRPEPARPALPRCARPVPAGLLRGAVEGAPVGSPLLRGPPLRFA
ncbi:hypothetical protein Q6348_05445 [Isoptericola sp. b441]|uniref:RDD domain-containing protein n=1 Tax=Actinotalea lenta TaxID=3064654 RepID=A0ABT9D717_9CELL|nr:MULTISPECIES: hypothetical protein [unclassified Isoptericola]MDO8106640.1 hypothetical protein [Isoptericola sp. b441]MDO8121652.1 hypothetical protein [Isoptericola sp. b490]